MSINKNMNNQKPITRMYQGDYSEPIDEDKFSKDSKDSEDFSGYLKNDEPLQDTYKNIPELKKVYDTLDKKNQAIIDRSIDSRQLNILRSLINPKNIRILFSLPKKRQDELKAMNIDDMVLELNRLRYNEEYEKGLVYPYVKTQKKIEEIEKPDTSNIKEAPEEIFGKDVELIEEEYIESKQAKEIKIVKPTQLQKQFEDLIDIYFNSNPYVTYRNISPELEVRFGTRDIKPLTKNDYDNVIKKLKSLGFKCIDENGYYSLRMQSEYIDRVTGTFRSSNIRTEIDGLHNIQSYCRNNDLKELIKQNAVKFTKKNLVLDSKKERVRPVNFDDFNFRVSYVNEENIESTKGTIYYMINNWSNSKKSYRFINRVTFSHPDYPVNIDISIVKKSDVVNGRPKTYYTTDESDVFNKKQSFEIELEINNSKIGPGTNFNSSKLVLESLRKVIKFVLSGLQGTNYPISYTEQKDMIYSYMNLINDNMYKDSNKDSLRVNAGNFIGPNSITLQVKNIAPINEESNITNIRKDFIVTDKADGERHMLFINDIGKIYLISSNMNIIFTGAKTFNKEYFESLVDGELIYHDKNGKFINLYAAFDLYYLKKKDVRALPFMPLPKEENINNSRYYLLNQLINNLKPVSIMEMKDNTKDEASTMKGLLSKFKNIDQYISPIRIECKKFYPNNPDIDNIFEACKNVLSKIYEYNTDGLILNHAYYGVGADAINIAGPKAKITWEYSFKWKPPQFNTIDFLITTVKAQNGEDIIKPIFEEGINSRLSTQLSEYKIIQLRCTFNEKRHGFINPCQDIIDDKLPEYKLYEDKEDKESKPVQFYPTNPYDPEAGICNIMLRKDDNNTNQMFTEENEVFTDNTIVEFRYELNNEKGWRWIPLRVRYDKTARMLQGAKDFGNAYHVANSNWSSIHNPVTEDMICTGLNIPPVSVDEDIYYNKPTGKMKTEALKNFHNLYVKKNLIKSVSKKGDILIDYACGKAGDLPKWISSHLSFVFGIDLFEDNLENKIDGACARYLKARRENKNMLYALFVNGNSSNNIKNGSAMLNDKAIKITKAIFGVGSKDPEVIGKGVARQYGVAQEGFNVSSCQFALHYFLKKPEILKGFLTNLAECTKLNGYFIGTAYDGKLVFNLLKKKQPGESIEIYEQDKKIWQIVKLYESDKFEDNSSSIGYEIGVYQESINQLLPEYLINFDYLIRVMENYGFKIIDRQEAQSLGLPEGTGLFSELYLNMLDEINKNKYKANDYGNAQNMTVSEKKISFLNRYFVFKKYRNVDIKKVELDLTDYDEDIQIINKKETKTAVKIAKQELNKLKPKIKQLNKKLLLIPATEAIEEQQIETQKKKKVDKIKKPKVKLIVEEDDDN